MVLEAIFVNCSVAGSHISGVSTTVPSVNTSGICWPLKPAGPFVLVSGFIGSSRKQPNNGLLPAMMHLPNHAQGLRAVNLVSHTNGELRSSNAGGCYAGCIMHGRCTSTAKRTQW